MSAINKHYILKWVCFCQKEFYSEDAYNEHIREEILGSSMIDLQLETEWEHPKPKKNKGLEA